MTTLSITALFVVEGAAAILERGLQVARVIGLPVDTWRTGDPTRSLYKYLAEKLATLEGTSSEYIKSGFLTACRQAAEASGSSEWLKILAYDVYGVAVPEATYASPTVTLTNTGGGLYEEDPLGLTFRATEIDKTYRNVSPFTINPGETITIDLIAEEAGSDSSVAANEIDAMVTTLNGVEIVSSTAAVASDEPTPAEIEELCRASTGALSPNGAPDAYEYVVKNSELTGVTDITRAKSNGDTTTGAVTVYVASPSGPVNASSITAAQDAVETWCTPLCVTPTVANAVVSAFALTASVQGTNIPADWETLVETELEALFARLPIGATVATSEIISTIRNSLVGAGAGNVIVTLASPAADTALAASAVPVLSAVTLTEV
jgi:hypothetical protein